MQATTGTKRGLVSSLKEALLGSHQDFTEGSIERAIFLLAVPMVLEMCMESLFGVVDVFWVARLGADAITTVGLTESGLYVVFSIALGLAMAATAMIARRIGEKNEQAAAVVAVQAMVIGVVLAAVTGVIGFIYAPDLLRVMGATEPVVSRGTSYTRMILSGSITIYGLFIINAIFRGAGDAATAMKTLWFANAVNILLNPCLIFGLGPFPKMGLLGSAVGTTIGRGAGVIFQLWVLNSGRSRICVRQCDVRFDLEVIGRLIRVSSGAVVQYLVQMASWIGVVRIIASFGSAAVAANTLAIRIIVFAILPSWGMANAAATLVGQNLGAGKPERAEKAVWRTGVYNMVCLGIVGCLFLLFAGPIIRAFTQDPAVVPLAITAVQYFSYGYLSYALGMVLSQAFNGAGDTFTPTILNLVCFWVSQIPLAYFLAITAGMGPKGGYIAVVFSDTLLAVLATIWFRRGAWKKQVV